MSAKLLQYAFLSNMLQMEADSGTTPDDKFCDLCRKYIQSIGGDFSSVSGSLEFRKASYLHQLATAIGCTVDTSSGDLLLASAKAIHDRYGLFGDAQGNSKDTRVSSYLNKSFGIGSAVWIGSGGLATGTDVNVNDLITPPQVTAAKYVGNPCVTFSGAQYVRATGYVPSIGSSDIYARARISFDAYPTAPELAFIMSQYATADNKRAFGFGINSGGYLAVFTSSNGTAANVQTATTNRFDLDTEYNVTIEKSGTVVNVTINDSSFTMPGSAVAILYASDAEFLVGASWLDYGAKTTRFFTSGCIFDAEFRVGGVQQIRCPMSEGWGTVNYDTSGNGRHGTMVNFTEATAWGQYQNNFCDQIEGGFSLYGN